MTLSLHTLTTAQRKGRRRRGRGVASGLGTYAGRGIKGQRARSSGRRGIRRRAIHRLIDHLPKVRGFQRFRPARGTVTLDALFRHFADGERVTVERLHAARLLRRRVRSVKVIRGRVRHAAKKLTVIAHDFSDGAAQALAAGGGSAQRVPSAKSKAPQPRSGKSV